jgi:hypothetical protein
MTKFRTTGLAWNPATRAWDMPVSVEHGAAYQANAWRNINKDWVKDIRQTEIPA